ncbi:MAG: YbaN family protein [Acidimicrobiia bacterium]|nr:YbaN family protein [Acidimicrobiia bacterium]
MAVVKNRALRGLLLVLGFVFVGIAFFGVFIPGLPTTGPVLLAAFFFSRSSERFDHWLVTNRFFGTIVQDWRAGRGFSVRGKIIAVTAILISFGITTIFFIDNIYVRIGMWALAAGVSAFVLTRPTKRADQTGEVSTEQASA